MSDDNKKLNEDASLEEDLLEGSTDAKSVEKLINELEVKSQENLRGWQRTAADLENYKKRSEKEKIDLIAYSQDQILMQFLGVLEDLDRMLKFVPESVDDKFEEWINGMLMVRKRFDDIMKIMQVEKIKTVGENFDPHKHEAIAQVEGGKNGIIAEEVSAGYTRGSTLLKPASVKVHKG